jgi:hypothetical protein
MGEKTVIIRLSADLPGLSPEGQMAVDLEKRAEAGIGQIIDIEGEMLDHGFTDENGNPPVEAPASKLDQVIAQKRAADAAATAADPALTPPADHVAEPTPDRASEPLPTEPRRRGRPASRPPTAAPVSPPPAAAPVPPPTVGRGEPAVTAALATSEAALAQIESALQAIPSVEALDEWETAAYELTGIFSKLLPLHRLACNKAVAATRARLAA